ncbi:hypothetical protein IKE71_03320 [Candidatus Saccharibacteria bacterium]|nr:hypothetical protein [Candidatus Saccharibacteria bacterium]
MELFIILISLVILAETSFLAIKKALEKTAKPRGRRKVFVDTSALIDGRVLNVAKTGFMSDDLLIPKSVTRELQLLADGKDSVKRGRARDGLAHVSELERVVYFNTEIFDDSHLGRMLVDERLLVLAKENNGAILTCDYNLAKVAETEGVEILNVNELALVFESKYQYGDRFRLNIIERGQDKSQGVGHLEDGTMVVVDGAGNRIGQEIEVSYLRYLQTSAGRMVFAEVAGRKKRSTSRKKTN